MAVSEASIFPPIRLRKFRGKWPVTYPRGLGARQQHREQQQRTSASMDHHDTAARGPGC
jgi:hypothetical protein